VICGEYGVTGDNANFKGMPEASRIRYIRDVNVTLAKYGVPGCLMAVDADNFHVPGNPAGAKTLDPITTAWRAALMPQAGWGKITA
jgi:hypothetical protein